MSVGMLASVGGCLDNGPLDSEMTSPEIYLETEVQESDGGFTFDGNVIEGFDDDSPARIRLRVTNDSEEEREFGFYATPPFSSYGGDQRDDDAELHLIPDDRDQLMSVDETGEPDEWVPSRPQDGCWQAMTEHRPVPPDTDRQFEPLGTEESVEHEYTVLSSPRNEDCLPAGEYVFEDSLAVGDHEDETEYELLLQLTVEGSQ
jgi:hypothetical protein